MKKLFLVWVFVAVIVTALSGLMFLLVQQNYRMTANDPQIEIVEDVASALQKGQPPQIIGTPSFDISQSLSPFITIYDSNGTPIASDANLDGKMPALPSGVFDQVKKKGQWRQTWQPRSGVRQAVVVASYTSGSTTGFIAAGRSLREIEKRERQAEYMTLAGWAVTLALAYLMLWLYHMYVQRKSGALPIEAASADSSDQPKTAAM